MFSFSSLALLAIAAQSLFTGVGAAVLPKRQSPFLPSLPDTTSDLPSITGQNSAFPGGSNVFLPDFGTVSPAFIPSGLPTGLPTGFASGLPSGFPTGFSFPVPSSVVSSPENELSPIDVSPRAAPPPDPSAPPFCPL
ncbi:hypothetical protein BDM02DRAFT_3183385 [Thelephora ganbajun]|uniref:Uncharacterized protein n=1 Tax=Thelephora ganbajun TaxID=370292 RepID=A0ACB6ZT53_THEGA|nr:hypothetical protein BDM02DRAFT_3183385 [Thelephora ganbajun]